MRDVVQEILHGISGQKLILDAPEGRASSVTSVYVFNREDDDDAPPRPATTGVAAIEANPDTQVATSPAGASQADPKAITLTDSTGVQLFRPYLIEAAAGDKEWFELVSLAATAGITRTQFLSNYAVGSTVKSTRISIVVDDTWIADKTNLSDESCLDARYRVSWTYVVGGVTYRRQTQFDVVRYTAIHHVTPPDVDARFPGWLDRLPVDYRREQGKPLIDQAWRAVRMDMRADGKLGRWLRNLDVVSELVICRANLMCVELAAINGELTGDALTSAGLIYRQRYEQLVREPHTSIGATPMGAQRSASRDPFLRR
jgi:hypothetical protein